MDDLAITPAIVGDKWMPGGGDGALKSNDERGINKTARTPATTIRAERLRTMASLIKRPNGNKWIQFVAHDGKRRTIRLGKLDKKNAEMILTKVEAMHSAKLGNYSLDRETSRWLAEVGDALHEKLAKAGLVADRAVEIGKPLDAALDEVYRKIQSETKPSTHIFYAQTRRNMLKCFGGTRSAKSITSLEADRFRQFLKAEGLSPTTIARRIVAARYYCLHDGIKNPRLQAKPLGSTIGG